MIYVSKLFLLPCNRGIHIECEVPNILEYANVYIDLIIIDTQDSYTFTGPSKTPIYKKTISGNEKSLNVTIKDSELLIPSMEDKMFFIYIITKGIPSPNTACGMDEPVCLYVRADYSSIYSKAMSYITESLDSCDLPKGFINFVLNFDFFKLALKAKEYILAIQHWNKLIRFTEKLTKNCKCNG